MAPKVKPHFCACGCGELAAQNIVHGINKGWLKYARGHQPPPPLCDPEVRAKANKARKKTIDVFYPIGSRRTRQVRDRLYWEVKVEGRQRWVLEHRWIMEQRLGRRLRSDEHVHHRDNDGLNNGLHADGQDNLVLMSATAHMELTQKEHPPEIHYCTCPKCGQKHFRKG